MLTCDSTDIGVLLVNLGTPISPEPKEIRKFLGQFLSDPRVVEIPAWIWRPILTGLILPLRAPKTAKLYQKIWRPEGSPLLYYSQLQAEKLQAALSQRAKSTLKVALGMNYGTPSIQSALTELKKSQRLVILPLYPQYSSATTASVFDAVGRVLKSWRSIPSLHMINHYADHKGYIAALTHSIKTHWQTNSVGEKLLFSFHGLPERRVKAGDPYFTQCHYTAHLVAKQLQLSSDQWQVVFQSRFGRQKWLQPYCDKTLISLANQGIKNIDVICPGFAADCLETLEEMEFRNKELFSSSGGEHLRYIPALNDQPEHIDALADIVMTYIH